MGDGQVAILTEEPALFLEVQAARGDSLTGLAHRLCGDAQRGAQITQANASSGGKGRAEEKRLHCHGQGYDVVERPMVRHDEDMALGTSMNIGLHPTFCNARLFVTVCDNFLIGPDGKIEKIHHTPRKIFEL